MSELTKQQSKILRFIMNYLKEYDYAPSYREIGDHLKLSSPATIHQHIQTLQSKGYLKVNAGEARSMELTKKIVKMGKSFELPLVGTITAGEPIEAIENPDTIAVPADIVRDENSYVLQVRGESMIEDGILDGDYVVVERNHSPRNGEIVVALLDNTYATLKRFYQEPTRIRLQPANSTMKPIYCKDVAIRGVVRALLRKFQTI